jgi:hypothetical protein
MTTTTLYRPVGKKELALVAASGWKQFPPRLDWQPIFYPVLNEEYATQIARDWNTKDPASDYEGHVLRFEVRNDHLAQYEVQTVGARVHQELWIPSDELEAFNAAIVGGIHCIATFPEKPKRG